MRKRLVAPVLLGLMLTACLPEGAPTPLPTSPPATTSVAVATATAEPTRTTPSPVVAGQPAPTPALTATAPTPPTATPAAAVPLTEEALKNAEYTVCGEKVRLTDNAGITNMPGLDYARQCKTSVERVAFGDLNGDQIGDAVVILYTFERSHRIPSIHFMVNFEGQPREITFQELPWEREVTALTLAGREAQVTLAGGPSGQAPETMRIQLSGP